MNSLAIPEIRRLTTAVTRLHPLCILRAKHLFGSGEERYNSVAKRLAPHAQCASIGAMLKFLPSAL